MSTEIWLRAGQRISLRGSSKGHRSIHSLPPPKPLKRQAINRLSESNFVQYSPPSESCIPQQPSDPRPVAAQPYQLQRKTRSITLLARRVDGKRRMRSCQRGTSPHAEQTDDGDAPSTQTQRSWLKIPSSAPSSPTRDSAPARNERVIGLTFTLWRPAGDKQPPGPPRDHTASHRDRAPREPPALPSLSHPDAAASPLRELVWKRQTPSVEGSTRPQRHGQPESMLKPLPRWVQPKPRPAAISPLRLASRSRLMASPSVGQSVFDSCLAPAR